MIGRRGGELWVWTSPVGAEQAVIRTSTRPHYDRAFDRVSLTGVVVWFERGLAINDAEIGWTPFTGFDVTWPGTPSVSQPTNAP
jgi:hypothetical protein